MPIYQYLLLSGLLLNLSCRDQVIDSTVTPDDSSLDDSTRDSTNTDTPSVAYMEPVAVGFEFFTGWKQETGELLGWLLSDGSVQPPYVTITLASFDFFYGEDPAETTCQLYAWFVIDQESDLMVAED